MNEQRNHDQEVSFFDNTDRLSLLDSIPPVSEEILPPDVCAEVFREVAHMEVDELLRDLERSDSQYEDEYPENFAEMLDTASGNLLQRAVKMWIKPKNPEETIRLMKQLQVDKFQAIATGVMRRMKKAMGIDSAFQTNYQTNYTLGKPNLNSMVDFATHKNTLNEIVHLFGMGWYTMSLLPFLASGKVGAGVIINFGAFMVNTYCVLAQRYSRARISIAIDKALARKKNFDPEEYKNILGLKLTPETE
jgi:hypothetical protein